MGLGETWAWARGVLVGSLAKSWLVRTMLTQHQLAGWFPGFTEPSLITVCPPGVFWTWSWPTDWIPALTSDLLPHYITDLDWSVLVAIHVSDMLPGCSLLFPPLIPEGAAGLLAQAYFLSQYEFRYAVPVLTGCQPASSNAGSQSSSSRKHSPRGGPLGSPSVSTIKPVRDASVLQVLC